MTHSSRGGGADSFGAFERSDAVATARSRTTASRARFTAKDPADPPQVLSIADRPIRYHGFYNQPPGGPRPGDAGAPVLVFLCGTFQGFSSFEREVEFFGPAHPILLVELPGQGDNLSYGGDLSFEDLADLLAKFLDELAITRCMLIGNSYGSGIAFSFAARYPERCLKLALWGCSPRVRMELARVIEFGLSLAEKGRTAEFAAFVLHQFFNLSLRHRTGVHRLVVRQVHKKLLNITRSEMGRYRDNARRIIDEDWKGLPSCPSLLMAGRYDHLMPPFEVAKVAAQLPHGTFVVMDSCDHLGSLAHPWEILNLLRAFVVGAPLEGLELVQVQEAATAPVERRLHPRVRHGDARVSVRLKDGKLLRGTAIDVSPDGCGLKLEGVPCGEGDGCTAHIEIKSANFRDDVLLWSMPGGARAVFMKTSLAAAAAIHSYARHEAVLA